MAASAAVVIHKLRHGIEQAADLPSCVALLRQEDQALVYLEGEDLVVNSDTISDLMRYWSSDQSIELRRRVGMLQA